jgi:hypothetical protein
MNAKEVKISTIEMEILWNESKRAYEDYQLKRGQLNAIPVEEPGTLEDFTEKRMIALSEISHGDIVLIEGKELKRVKANFKVREEFKNANGKNNHE